MPLQNRVTPLGEIIATPARGTMMGNRGGRLHDDARRLGRRRWASRAWICCRLEFKSRHRDVWGDSYTELFFLDEPTALAAGHRPCFECRRADALAFAWAWARAGGESGRPRAADIDRVLHRERLGPPARRPQVSGTRQLPDGAFVAFPEHPEQALAVYGGRLLRWTPDGYTAAHDHADDATVSVLTPLHSLAALAAGYVPQWHASAQTWAAARDQSASDP